MSLTSGDWKRIKILESKLETASDDKQRELLLRKFFLELTNELFDSLDTCSDADGLLDISQLLIFGIDTSDAAFIRHVIREYNYDITISRKCCL